MVLDSLDEGLRAKVLGLLESVNPMALAYLEGSAGFTPEELSLILAAVGQHVAKEHTYEDGLACLAQLLSWTLSLGVLLGLQAAERSGAGPFPVTDKRQVN